VPIAMATAGHEHKQSRRAGHFLCGLIGAPVGGKGHALAARLRLPDVICSCTSWARRAPRGAWKARRRWITMQCNACRARDAGAAGYDSVVGSGAGWRRRSSGGGWRARGKGSGKPARRMHVSVSPPHARPRTLGRAMGATSVSLASRPAQNEKLRPSAGEAGRNWSHGALPEHVASSSYLAGNGRRSTDEATGVAWPMGCAARSAGDTFVRTRGGGPGPQRSSGPSAVANPQVECARSARRVVM